MPRTILTYHPARMESLTRAGCDLLALEADLALLAARGIPVVSLGDILSPDCEHGVAITFDDGARMDAESYVHPRHGALPSALDILRRFGQRLPRLKVASFVIASPAARMGIQATLTAEYGPELLHQRWWGDAQHSGLMQIENHSWDHNHPVLARSVQRDNVRGRFDVIETEAEAEAEIARASDYIAAQTGMRPVYFAYPFGQTNDFLATDYLPRRGAAIGLRAAFTTDPRPLNDDDSRWLLPRYVCGRDWCDDLGLERLITAP